jgi:hypothetical protein
MIAGALADVCACMIFFNSNTLAQHSLVGTIWNLDCLEYMLREVNRQRIAAWMKYKGEGNPG